MLRQARTMLSEGEKAMKGRSVHDLLNDYEFALQTKHLPKDAAWSLREFHRLILSRQHILAQDPTQLGVHGSGQPEGGSIRRTFQEWPGLIDRWQFRARHPLPQPQWELTIPIGARVTALASCTQSNRMVLLVGCAEDLVLRYDAATGKEITPPLTVHTGWITAVCALDADRVVTGDYDITARVWDIDSDPCRCLLVFPFDYPVTCLTVLEQSPPLLVVGLADGQVQFFRIENG
jgi:WD40 repeat protein